MYDGSSNGIAPVHGPTLYTSKGSMNNAMVKLTAPVECMNKKHETVSKRKKVTGRILTRNSLQTFSYYSLCDILFYFNVSSRSKFKPACTTLIESGAKNIERAAVIFDFR